MLKLPRWRITLRASLGLILWLGLILALIAHSQRRQQVRRSLAQPIIDAAEAGDTARVIDLLDRGADVDSITNGRFPWTPLMEAAFRGRRQTVLELIRRGADLNHTDLDAFSAATLAAGKGFWSIVGDLAEAGADLDQRDGYGKSTFDHAREQNIAGLGSKPPDGNTPRRP